MASQTRAERNALQLAGRRKAIFAACRQLEMDEDTRRAMLREVAKVERGSTSELDLDKADLVLEHLRKVGAARPMGKREARSAGHHPGAPSTIGREPYLQKIEAQLAEMGLPWAYADRIAENITGGKAGGIQRLAWVHSAGHLRDIVAALAYEQTKRALLEQVDQLLKVAGKTREDVAARAPQLPKNWTRQIKPLRAVINAIPVLWPEHFSQGEEPL